MRLEPGAWWAYHFDKNIITYPIREMAGQSDAYCLGVIHELAHRLYSRLEEHDDMKSPGFHFLWNAVVNVRINKLISSRYAGVPALLDAVYQEHFTGPTAVARRAEGRAEQFGMAFIYEWASVERRTLPSRTRSCSRPSNRCWGRPASPESGCPTWTSCSRTSATMSRPTKRPTR